MKKYFLLIFTTITLIYLELVFSFTLFKSITKSFIYTFLFSLSISLIIYLIGTLFKKSIVNKLLYTCTMVFIILFFVGQVIYYELYESLISFLSLTTGTGQVFGFADEILRVALIKALPLSLMLIPLILLIILLFN